VVVRSGGATEPAPDRADPLELVREQVVVRAVQSWAELF
jgi:hypothetical protein